MSPKPQTAERPAVRWLVLFGVWLLYFSFGLGLASLAPLVAPVTRDLNMSNSAMGSVLGAWQLIYIFVALPCGLAIARFGARRMLIIGASLIALSGFCRALSVDHLTLFLSVALFGLGGPIVSVGAPQVAANWFKGSERGLAMGIYISGPGVAGLLVLGSTNAVLMPYFGDDWRMVLRLWAGIAVAAGIVWTLIFLHPQVRTRERSRAALAAPPRFSDIADLLRIPGFAIILAMGIGVFVYTHGLGNWLPELLRHGGLGAAEAGIWASLPVLVGTIGALVIPRFATKDRRVRVLLLLLTAAGLSGFCLGFPPGPVLFAGLVLQGFAYASLMTVTLMTLLDLPGVDEDRAGLASGLYFSIAEIGGVTGPLALGILYDLTGEFAAGRYLLIVNAAILMMLTSWLVRVRRATSAT